MMRRLVPLMLLAAAACSSSGPNADLEAIKQARSLGAEWAMVNDQAVHGKITGTYATTMRKRLRDQLQTAANSLTQPRSRYGSEIQMLLAKPGDATAGELRAHVRVLKQIEDSLESA